MKKRIISIILIASMCMSITGCADTGETGEVIENIEPLSYEDIAVQDVEKTRQTEEAAVYKFLTNTLTLQTENLIATTQKEEEDVGKLVAEVNDYLATGESLREVISETVADYMLLEFARTPYKWDCSSVKVLGVDAPTNLIFADVTYKTNSTKKEVLPVTSIVKGDATAESQMQQRYADYMLFLNMTYGEDSIKANNNTNNTPTSAEGTPNDATTQTPMTTQSVGKYQKEFEDKWGKIDDLLLTQNSSSLLNLVKNNAEKSTSIGGYTYAGLATNEETMNSGAEITFRFVMKYDYVWGTANTLSVQSVYLNNYKLDNAENLVSSKKNENNIQAYESFIIKQVDSFEKAVDSTNHSGLFKLMSNYGKWDLYYEALKNYTYRHFMGFTYDIVGLEGNKLTLEVTTKNQIRAKNTNMSLPTYEEKYLLELILGENDEISISDNILLSSELVGEPLSVVKDVTGISEQLLYSATSFTKANEEAIYEAVKNFAGLELTGEVNSTDTFNVVDLGISSTAKNTLNENIQSLQDIGVCESAIFIQDWSTKSNTYVVLQLRELFVGESTGYDTNATLSLANTNDGWRVISYVRNEINRYDSYSSLPDTFVDTADFYSKKENGVVNTVVKVSVDNATDEENAPTSSGEDTTETSLVEETAF